jgi:transcriptional regulator with XRE-family HTH domain
MSTEWAPGLTSRIAGEIRSLRGDNSAQWLSDRTDELGHRVSRSTISELETGKRQTIAIDALIVLAKALGVAPADLLYPGSSDVEVLPGVTVKRSQAVEALAGTAERLERIQAEAAAAAEAIRGSLEDLCELAARVPGAKDGR